MVHISPAMTPALSMAAAAAASIRVDRHGSQQSFEAIKTATVALVYRLYHYPLPASSSHIPSVETAKENDSTMDRLLVQV